MKMYTGILFSMALAISMLPQTVSATPAAQGSFDGRYYEIIAAHEIDWNAANAAANAATHDGVNGHLATITSAAEDAFIDSLRRSAYLDYPEVWVGGVTLSTCSPIPGCGWTWVNGEGPISTPQVPLPSYSNWLEGPPQEPNNAGGSEKHIGVGLYDKFGWNDEGNLGLIGGYVIEYDTPTLIDPGECTDGSSCETTLGQSLVLPSSSLGAAPEIGIRTYEFTDDPLRCGVSPLVLFDTDGDPDNDLIIPPYLCGSPNFLIVQVETADINITEGIVEIENEVTDALPGNLYGCTGPIDPMMLLSLADTLDPQHRDKVTYQRDNPADMLENSIGATIDPMFAGAMTDLTHGCGSSRGKVMRFSYLGIGLSFNFGAGYDLETNPDANFERIAALTKYKLLVLKAALIEAKEKGSINLYSYGVLWCTLELAIQYHDSQHYDWALWMVETFNNFSKLIDYGAVENENYSGEHEARASNIEFMYTDSILPFYDAY